MLEIWVETLAMCRWEVRTKPRNSNKRFISPLLGLGERGHSLMVME